MIRVLVVGMQPRKPLIYPPTGRANRADLTFNRNLKTSIIEADEEWDELTGHQRWYRKNLEYSTERKERRRRELTRWLCEY